MENSKQISDFPQSSDFIGDQKICSYRNLRNGLTRELSLQNRINHSSEKPYKCPEFFENLQSKLMSDHPQEDLYRWEAYRFGECEESSLAMLTFPHSKRIQIRGRYFFNAL